MTSVNEIIKTVDTSKMEREGVYFLEMCESEFEIFEFLTQPKKNERLTYCYYHRWICTDTEVGIRVWYFDNEPACISWKSYRKSDEVFGWISEEKFNKVKNYAVSLKEEDDFEVNIIDDETMKNVIAKFNSIDFKKFEKRNLTNV